MAKPEDKKPQQEETTQTTQESPQAEQSATPQYDVTLKTRLSVKDALGANVKDLIGDKKIDISQGAVPIIRITGEVSGFEYAESMYGINARFVGDIVAQSLLDTKRIVRASNCFLPKVAADLMESTLLDMAHGETQKVERHINNTMKIIEKVEIPNRVEFAFDIYVEYSKQGAGYTFSAKSLISPKSDDRLTKMLGRLPALPQLK
jgi:hypothetical protein